ncbi:tRNA pseudouridine(55) synthase TruB [bacterium]|nr:tRNA pseudouridine(55) synthase TruB [bacterium]
MHQSAAQHRGLIPLENGGHWLLIDKPAGITSHDVVDRVRRLTGEKKVGHAGTLDPMATGLLVVALGKATKQLAEGLEGGKRYIATGKLGVLTPTGDEDAPWRIEGRVPVFEQERLVEVLGVIRTQPFQIPPMVSAIKRFGIPLYKMIRRGWWLDRDPRDGTIESLELVGFEAEEGQFVVDVAAGGGFYVRALVRDIGAALGVPAGLTALRRLAVGPFRVEDAVTLEQAETMWAEKA